MRRGAFWLVIPDAACYTDSIPSLERKVPEMKKCVSIMLAVILPVTLLSMGTFTVTAGYEEKLFGDYTYNVIEEEISIVDVDTAVSGDVVIPSSIEGLPVTSIGDRAFDKCDQMVTLKIPSGVTAIGEAAFEECTGLTKFIVGATSKAYCARDGVLFNKDRTTLVCYPAGKTDTAYAVPDGVTSVDTAAFGWASYLESVTVADGVKKLSERAFAACSALRRVTFGVGLTEIGVEAFADCTALEAVTIPNSVTSVGRAAFSECGKLSEVTFGSGLTSLNGTLFLNCTSLKTVAIPDNVTSIVSSAFAGCSNLETITIPDSVTGIGAYVFYGCESLKTVLYTGSEAEKNALVIGAKNEPLSAAEWQYNAPSAEPSAEDTSVGPQPIAGPDSNVLWWWVMIGGIAVVLTAAAVTLIVILAKGIKARK